MKFHSLLVPSGNVLFGQSHNIPCSPDVAAAALATLSRAVRRVGSVAGSVGAITDFRTTPVELWTTPSGVTCWPGASEGVAHNSTGAAAEGRGFNLSCWSQTAAPEGRPGGARAATNPRYGGALACRRFRRHQGHSTWGKQGTFLLWGDRQIVRLTVGRKSGYRSLMGGWRSQHIGNP